ncbi:MAG: DNA mismatch repair protein MutS, partial [Bdellovibrionota bacterium]
MPTGKAQENPAELPLEGAGPTSPAMRLTPAMAQYFEAKRQHPDALLFFRIGDFYELFFDDALKAAPLLEIALTTRDKNKGEDAVPMCGVPHHAAETYIRRLTDRGIKVAICDQVEDPAKAKGIVRREVVRLVTPGMPLEEEGSQRRDRYVLSFSSGKQGRWGLAALDAATGAFPVAEISEQDLGSELARLAPAEIVFAEGTELPPPAAEFVKTHATALTSRAPLDFRSDRAEGLLKDHFGLGSLQGFGLTPGSPALAAAGALVAYVREAGKAGATHVRELHPYRPGGSLVLDESTLANLEIFAAQGGREERGALVGAIDRTTSAAGSRCFRRWLLYPLVEVSGIQARQDAVEAFKDAAPAREEARSVLSRSCDIERIAAKACQGRASPRDLWALRRTLEEAPRIAKALAASEKEALVRRGKALPLAADLLKEIAEVLVEEPPVDFGDSPVIRPGFSSELDSLREARAGGKEWIARLEAKERERTGIGSL